MEEMSGSLVEPLEFEDGEIQRFIRRNKCGICRSHLLAYPNRGRRTWRAECPTCGPVMAHNAARTETIERVAAGERAARAEIERKPDKRSAEEILKSLGF